MEKNDLLPENSLIKKLKNRLNNNKKSLIRLMAGLGASAMLLTGVACDETHTYEDTTTDNSPIIDKETDYTYQGTEPVTTNPVETEPVDTKPVETEPVETEPAPELLKPTEYISDYAKNLFSSAEYESYKASFDQDKQNGQDCFGTKFNATCFDYFRNLYPQATDNQILYGTRLYFDCVSDNDLYVALSSSDALLFRDDLGASGIEIFSLLKFENIGDFASDLTYSRGKTLEHALILNHVLNNMDYEVVAENTANYNDYSLKKLDMGSSKASLTAVNGVDRENNTKYFYFLAPNQNHKGIYSLYKASSEYGSQYDLGRKYGTAYPIEPVGFNEEEELTIEEVGAVDYNRSYNFDIPTSNVELNQ